MKVAWFTTDWQMEPVLDEVKTRLYGRQVFIPGKKRASYGGTFYQRGAMPAMELERHGYEVILSWRFEQMPDGRLQVLDQFGNWHNDIDIFWSQRWMHEDGAEQMRRARAAGIITVADLDDGFKHLPKSNIAYTTTSPEVNKGFNRDHYWKMLAACDAVTVSTEALARDMEILGVPTFICKNVIDLERWPVFDPGARELLPGWVGGIQWRAADLLTLRPFLPQFLLDYGLSVYHGGDSEVPGVQKFYEQAGINPQQTECIVSKLCNVGEYPSLWQPINLALVPLEQHPFNVRKSHLKGLEASACGIPYIYSSKMPEYDAFGGGIRADNSRPKTWRAALDSMLDPEARREEGTRNRAIAEKWDIHDKWTQWDDVFKSLKPDVVDKTDNTRVISMVSA